MERPHGGLLAGRSSRPTQLPRNRRRGHFNPREDGRGSSRAGRQANLGNLNEGIDDRAIDEGCHLLDRWLKTALIAIQTEPHCSRSSLVVVLLTPLIRPIPIVA